MATFSVGGVVATFDASRDNASDHAGMLEEQRFKILVPDAITWADLFGMVTPKDYVSVRACKRMDATNTITVDIGGGAGAGNLSVEEFDAHQAILVDLNGDAPVTGPDGPRFADASFLIIPGT